MMTNEEAIEILESYKQISMSFNLEEDIEALDMAIKALQENQKLIEEVKKWKTYFEEELANKW